MNLASQIKGGLSHPELSEQYNCFVEGLQRIAALNIATGVSERALQMCLPDDARFRLSDDFPEGYTTILSAEQLRHMSLSGEFSRMIKELSVIAMCSMFESFVDQICEIAGVSTREASSYNSVANDFGLRRGSDTPTLRKIYYMIKKFGFNQHPFEHDQAVDMLHELFCIRNAIVHHGGAIRKQNHMDAIWSGHRRGGNVFLSDDAIDDFLHRIVIHMSGFTARVDQMLLRNGANPVSGGHAAHTSGT